MRKTEVFNNPGAIAVDIKGLRAMLSCGRDSAAKIGDAAGATFRIGKRILYKVDKVNAYIDSLTEQTK